MAAAIHSPENVRAFFADSNGILDHVVARPLSHITGNWEMTWDSEAEQYSPEKNSFASILNNTIVDISNIDPPERYHDNEDRLAEYVIKRLGWPLQKKGGIWIGADYDSILEQGGFDDIDQEDLLTAAAGRVQAALARGQSHFDDMEESHRRMLGAVLTIILYHRGNEVGYQLE